MVVYSYAPGRRGDYALALLKDYTGVLQTDGYAGYRALADPKRPGGPATLAFCWAHWCRQSFDLAKSPPAPIAVEALKRIAELYEIEAEIRGKSARRRARRSGAKGPQVSEILSVDSSAAQQDSPRRVPPERPMYSPADRAAVEESGTVKRYMRP